MNIAKTTAIAAALVVSLIASARAEEVVDLVANPELLKDIELPKLVDATLVNPAESEKANERGRVRLTFVVGTDGAVSDVKITGASQYWRLNDAAVATVVSRSYLPATRSGKPIAVRIWAVDAFNPDPAAPQGFDAMDDETDRNMSCRYGTHHIAVDACTALIRADKGQARFYLYPRANAYAALSEYNKAISDYDKLIAATPDRAELYRNRGFAYEASGDYEHAVKDYDQALKLDTKNSEFYLDRGFAHDRAGARDLALADFKAGLDNRPRCDVVQTRGVGADWTPAPGSLDANATGPTAVASPFHETKGGGPGGGLGGSNGAGNIQHVTGNQAGQDKATIISSATCKPSWVLALDQIPAIQPGASDEAQRLEYRCWARTVWNKELDAAIADCDRAIQLHPGFVRAYATRGWARLRKGNTAAATDDLNAALSFNPRLASALYVRGLAKWKEGDTTGAEADILKARTIDPEIAATYARYEMSP